METATQNYRTDWMKTGATHITDKDRINSIIDRMPWDYDFRGKDVPMMPGMAISSIIKEMRLPKVSAVSYGSHELAPYGIYGIEATFKNAKIRLIIVDEGSQCVPICARVWDH